jgi:hypothetical protein
MRYRNQSVCFLAAVLLLCACSSYRKQMSRVELISYINDKDNGLVKEQESNGVQVKLSFEPSSLLAAQQLSAMPAASKVVIDSTQKKYTANYYFLLKFSKGGKEAIRQLGSFSRYSDMVQVLSFQMHRFINLTTPQKDTIALADYLFDQTYGMSDGNTILLCFDRTKLIGKDQLHINVAECGLGTGNLTFSFNQKDISKVPVLKLPDSIKVNTTK